MTQQASLITSLQTCLVGVEQALNELAVGESGRVPLPPSTPSRRAALRPRPPVADRRRTRRRRWLAASVAALCAGALVAATWTDIDARTRNRKEQAALAAANSHLAWLRHRVAVTQFAKAVTKSKRDVLQSSIATTMSQLAVANGSLTNANVHAYVQGVGIDTLQTCLGGVKNAFSQITAENNAQAAKDISAVSGACTQLAGGTSTGLVYPSTSPTLRSSWWARPTTPTPRTRSPGTSRSSTPPTSPTGPRSAMPCRASRPGPHPTTPGPPPSP